MKDTPGWTNDCYITVHDDDDSPFEGVVELLRRCIGFGRDNAQGWARQISRSGNAQLGPWTSSIARSIHDEMTRLAPAYGCRKLRVVLEDQSEQTAPATPRSDQKAHHLLSEVFGGWPADSLVIVKREFPAYLRVDVQNALDLLTTGARRVGIHTRNRFDASDMASLISERDQAKLVGALQFEDVDIGEGSRRAWRRIVFR